MHSRHVLLLNRHVLQLLGGRRQGLFCLKLPVLLGHPRAQAIGYLVVIDTERGLVTVRQFQRLPRIPDGHRLNAGFINRPIGIHERRLNYGSGIGVTRCQLSTQHRGGSTHPARQHGLLDQSRSSVVLEHLDLGIIVGDVRHAVQRQRQGCFIYIKRQGVCRSPRVRPNGIIHIPSAIPAHRFIELGLLLGREKTGAALLDRFVNFSLGISALIKRFIALKSLIFFQVAIDRLHGRVDGVIGLDLAKEITRGRKPLSERAHRLCLRTAEGRRRCLDVLIGRGRVVRRDAGHAIRGDDVGH